MYVLGVSTSRVYPQMYEDRFRRDGLSVRCVFGSTMQNVTTNDLAAMMPNTGDTTTLMDSRDGTEYTIGKLADGKYWMLDNLALGSTSAMTLTNTNTNMTAASWTLPASTTTGFDSSTGYTTAAINAASKTTTESLAVGQSGTGKIGVYYNYCAATAGTYCESMSQTGTSNATSDICPKGWRFPTGGTSGEFQALRNQYTSDTEYVLALRTPLSGNFYSESARNQGSYGRFWSSTYYNAASMYLLSVSTTYAGPQGAYDRHFGFSVRCIKQ